ncbi:gentisate 1,2-dioxygenase [Lipomyces doorenjongii]
MSSIGVSPVQVHHQKNGLILKDASILKVNDHPEIDEIEDAEQNLSVDVDCNVAPLWTIMHKMVPPRPNPQSVNTKWPYTLMKKELMKAAEVVSAEEAERRVLILVNQAMRAPYTTDTIYAGLQIVLPGEIAPAHRHRAFALRFIIEGSGGFTAVEGEKIEMFPGDVILTPSWSWHDHGNEGKDPIIWLDGLDLPLWQFLPINFLQQYSEARYPSTPSAQSPLRFPWSDVAQKLDADQSQHAVFHYRQHDGSHLSKTISAQAERIAPGFTTSPGKDVFSFVYHVYEGNGFTTIKSPISSISEKIEWKGKDTFAVPAWSEITHTCTSQERSAYLFAINDRPIVEALTFASTDFLGKSV